MLFEKAPEMQIIWHFRLVHIFRNWVATHADGGIPWPKGMSDDNIKPLPRNDMFDVYKAHTCTCTVCKTALRNLKILRGTMVAATALAILKGGHSGYDHY